MMPSINTGLMLFCVFWVLGELYLLWSFYRIPRFHLWQAGEPGEWPRISIVVPACNEAEHLQSAVETLLQQDYPQLELILVNDRSTDKTGEIIDQLAADNDCIKPVHITSLPADWLGKVHALHQGAKVASGDWMLFTDADIHFEPDTLRRAIAIVTSSKADHLALLPDVITRGFWLKVTVHTFGLLFLLTTRAASVNRPGSRTPIGIGAFNLVRRGCFDQTAGFGWLALEPGDDMALGMLIRRVGGRTLFAVADRHLSVQWYPSLSAMFRGLEKNLFGPGAHYQWWRAALQVLLLWTLLAALPAAWLLALVQASHSMLSVVAVTTMVHIFFSVIAGRGGHGDKSAFLLAPAGLFLISLMMLRASWLCVRNNGIDWRGTHYPLAALRAGQRVKF